MGNITMTRELKSNCEANKERLLELYKEYELAKLGFEVQSQQEWDIMDSILADNEFFASEDFSRVEKHRGERIRSNEDIFMLSESEHSRFWKIANPLFVEAKIADENGYYITNWLTIEVNAKKALVNFLIDNIIPQSMRAEFVRNRQSVVMQDKLIKAFESCFHTK